MSVPFRWNRMDVDTLVAVPKRLPRCPDASNANLNACFTCSVVLINGDFANVEIRFRSFGLGTSLLVNGVQIRGLDHHRRKMARNGVVIRDWHEDYWVFRHVLDTRSAAVSLANPPGVERQQVVDAALALWNI